MPGCSLVVVVVVVVAGRATKQFQRHQEQTCFSWSFLSECATSQSLQTLQQFALELLSSADRHKHTHTQNSTAAVVASTLPHIEPIKYANFGKGSESVYSRSFSGELSAVCVCCCCCCCCFCGASDTASGNSFHPSSFLSFPFLFLMFHSLL